jgi:hypothetical protein
VGCPGEPQILRAAAPTLRAVLAEASLGLLRSLGQWKPPRSWPAESSSSSPATTPAARGRGSRGIRAYYDKVPEPKRLVVVDGSARAQFLFTSNQAEQVMTELVRFLAAP